MAMREEGGKGSEGEGTLGIHREQERATEGVKVKVRRGSRGSQYSTAIPLNTHYNMTFPHYIPESCT